MSYIPSLDTNLCFSTLALGRFLGPHLPEAYLLVPWTSKVTGVTLIGTISYTYPVCTDLNLFSYRFLKNYKSGGGTPDIIGRCVPSRGFSKLSLSRTIESRR